MSAYEAPELDPEHTILVPLPEAALAASQAQAQAQGRMLAPPIPESDPLGGAMIVLAATSDGDGLNPLVRAANPLFELVMPLRSMTSYPDVEQLRMQLMAAIQQFDVLLKTGQAGDDASTAASFSLCTLLDEAISSTPWGCDIWASRSLLVAFHNEASGGEKFFEILQQLMQNVPANLHVLELMYLCLVFGLEGRYKVIDHGRSQLELLRERLYQLIQAQRGAFEPQLSLHWQGTNGKGSPFWRLFPVWILAAGAATFWIALQLGLSWRLNQLSDPVIAALYQIKVAAAATPMPDVPAPAPAPVLMPAPAPMRVADIFATEIGLGLLSVNETADRTIVTLRGDGVFASGSAVVTPELIPLLERVGDALKALEGNIIVIGHTDNVMAKTGAKFASNLDLSQARANAVKALLAQRAGPAERYTVEGRGDTEALVANDNAANRARNRRVDIIVLKPLQSP